MDDTTSLAVPEVARLPGRRDERSGVLRRATGADHGSRASGPSDHIAGAGGGDHTVGGAARHPRLPSVCTRPSFAISVTTWAPVGAAWQAPEDLQCACLAGGAG